MEESRGGRERERGGREGLLACLYRRGGGEGEGVLGWGGGQRREAEGRGSERLGGDTRVPFSVDTGLFRHRSGALLV